MRVFFAGTPGIALPSLVKLSADHKVVGVLTNPDRRSGRGMGVSCCPVKLKADELGLDTFQPETIDDGFIEKVRMLKPDVLAVTAYGRIFKKNFLDIFPQGGLNVHPSLLPKYRGASPIQSALLSGDSETGISVQRLALRMDSGSILAQETYTYKGFETAGWLTDYFAERGGELLTRVITGLENGESSEKEQDESMASYCSYISKNDGLIDWSNSAVYLERKLRAFTPWPGIFTFFGNKKLNIIEARVYDTTNAGGKVAGSIAGTDKSSGILIQTGQGILAVQKLQLQSKKALDWKSFINGVKDFSNAVLGGE
jgi:methionyl-tRNA formyltransferase